MNVGWLVENIVWTIVYLIACFAAGYIVRPMIDKLKEKNKKIKESIKNATNEIKVDGGIKDEKLVQ